VAGPEAVGGLRGQAGFGDSHAAGDAEIHDGVLLAGAAAVAVSFFVLLLEATLEAAEAFPIERAGRSRNSQLGGLPGVAQVGVAEDLDGFGRKTFGGQQPAHIALDGLERGVEAGEVDFRSLLEIRLDVMVLDVGGQQAEGAEEAGEGGGITASFISSERAISQACRGPPPPKAIST